MNTCRVELPSTELRRPRNNWRGALTRLIGSLLFIFIGAPAFAQLPYCSDYFKNGLQTHSDNSFIHFHYNAQLVNAAGRFLQTPNVEVNAWSQKRSCGEKFCENGGTPVDGMNIPYLDFNSTDVLVVPSNQSVTLGANNLTTFGTITVEDRAVVTFAARPDPYLITRLQLGYKSKLRLPAGEYWVGQFNLEVEGRIDVIGEGTVTLYVIDSLWVPFNFQVNGNTKDPARLGIYTFSDSNYYTGSKAYAFIRTEGEVILNHKASIFGGVLGRFITLESESQVVFDPDALPRFTFGELCAGAAPVNDVIPPIIEIDYSFANPTTNSQITVTGSVTDPGNPDHWITAAAVSVSSTATPLTLIDGQFSVNLALNPGINAFIFSATDGAENTARQVIYIWREDAAEFSIRLGPVEYPYPSPLLILRGVITAAEGDVITHAFVTTPQGQIPLVLDNNKFTVELPVVVGDNDVSVTAQNQAGDEITEVVVLQGSSEVVFENIRSTGDMEEPERLVTGRVHSAWPAEQLILTIDEIPQPLTVVSPGVYAFAANINLTVGRNRIDFVVTTPTGEIFAVEFDDWYEPDRVFLYITTPETDNTPVETDTLEIVGSLHLPSEYFGTGVDMVVISDRYPDEEFAGLWLGNPGAGGEFSAQIPLAPGLNTLLVKAIRDGEDLVIQEGVSQIDIRVIRLE